MREEVMEMREEVMEHKSDAAVVRDGLRLRSELRDWMEEWYGPRCHDHDPDCDGCKVWAAWDTIFSTLED